MVTTMLDAVPDVKEWLSPWVQTGAEPGIAPDGLEHLRALLNTDNRFAGLDTLKTTAPSALRTLRDALRAFIVEGNPAPLDALAAGHRLSVRVGASGPVLAADDETAALLAMVFDEYRAGRLQRLKACANPDCQWVYFDGSRNRSGRWCSMNECGDVMKARSYRRRARGEDA
ncbi:CGNR zinc finger domain-containing protein [Propionicimonas sp.]|uniref:CGNR zinc finger domain-containing protein n=1 Tax=Propionicimonas sp. TaxID=1955623 RepID=UPI0039E53B74